MTNILGISGKKGAGKDTCLNWIMSNYLVGLQLVEWAKVDEKGRLLVSTNIGEGDTAILDVNHPGASAYLSEYVWPFCKNFSFATPLKTFCMQVFGLSYEQVYGTNADKDTLTQFRWEDMPYRSDTIINGLHITEKSGQMSGREVLQYFGTNVCRQMYDDCWVDTTIRKIQKQAPALAIVTDVRFPKEVEGIQRAGGKVLRLTRAPFAGQDEHESETALDGYEGFDFVLDNSEMNITQQNQAVTQILIDWKFVNWVITQSEPSVEA